MKKYLLAIYTDEGDTRPLKVYSDEDYARTVCERYERLLILDKQDQGIDLIDIPFVMPINYKGV